MTDSSNNLRLARSTSSAAPVASTVMAPPNSAPATGVDSATSKVKSTKPARRRKPAAKANSDQAGASTSPLTSTSISISTPTPSERPAEHETKENTNIPSAPKKARKKVIKERKSPVPVATPSTSTLAANADSVIPPPPLTPSWDDQLVASISAQGSLAVDDLPTLHLEKLSLDQLEATPTVKQIVAGEAHVAHGEKKVLSKKAQRDLQLKMREPQGYERMMELRKQKRKERNKKKKEDVTKDEQPSEKKEIKIKGSAAFVAAVGVDEPEVTDQSTVDETSTQAENGVPKAPTPVQTKGPAPVAASTSTAPSIPTGPAAYRYAAPVRNQPSRQQEQSLIRAGPRVGPSPAPVPGSINPRFAHLPFHPHYRYPMPKTAPNAHVTPASKSATPLASNTNKKSPTTVPTPMPTTRPAAVEECLFGEGRAQSVVRLPSSSSLPVVFKVSKPTTPTLTSAPVEVSTPAVPISLSQSTSQEPMLTPTPSPTSVLVSLPTQPQAPETSASIVAPPPQYSAIPTHPVLRNIPPHIQRLATPPSAPLSPIAVAPLPSHFYPQPQPSLYLPYYPHQPTPTTYYGSTTSNEGYSPILLHGTATPPPPHHQHMAAEAGRPSPFFAPVRHSKALDIKAPPANYSATHPSASVGQGTNARQLPPYQYPAQAWAAQTIYPSSSSRESSRSPVMTSTYPIQTYVNRGSPYYGDDGSNLAYYQAQTVYDPYYLAAAQQHQLQLQQQQQQQIYAYPTPNAPTPMGTHQVQYHQGMSYYPASEGIYGGQYYSDSITGEVGEGEGGMGHGQRGAY